MDLIRELRTCRSFQYPEVMERAADEIERLQAALERYGAHDISCIREPWHGKGPARCSCMFFDVLCGAVEQPPGHTDLMVKPESLDGWLRDNPLPDEQPMRQVTAEEDAKLRSALGEVVGSIVEQDVNK